MRFFPKRKSAIEIDELGSGSIPNLHDNKLALDNGRQGRVVNGDTFPSYANEEDANIDHEVGKSTSREYESPKNKQSIGELVRRLNCTSSKKDSFNSDEHFTVGGEIGYSHETDFAKNYDDQPKSTLGPSRIDTSSEITRPVLITVKNGATNYHFPPCSENEKNLEMKNRFIVGQLSKPITMNNSPSFRFGMSSRKRNINATKYFKNPSSKDNTTRDGVEWHNNSFSNQRNINEKRAAQEAARRERWKRGLEMENRMFKNSSTTRRRGGDGYDSSSTESRTIGSHTTGTSTTGYDTAEDSISTNDWTDVTDESRFTPKYHRRYRRNSSDGPCADSHEIVESVAEDFGIIAQLLLSDGYACFGTAAAITRETVGGCRR